MSKTSLIVSARLMSLALAVACATATAQTPVGAASNAAQHWPTNEDLRHLKAMSSPRLSPDGKQVLFTVTEATADEAKSHLWLVNAPVAGVAAEKARQITYSPAGDKRGEFGGQWSPDGTAVLFLAKRGEQTQLYRLDMRGGEALAYDFKVPPSVDESKVKGAIPPEISEKNKDEKPPATPELLPIDVSGFALSTDGKWMAVWAGDPETPGEKKQKEAKADALWVNRGLHGMRLYLAALNADGTVDGRLRPVAVAPDVHEAVWSPAADKLLVLTEQPNGADDLAPAGAAWLVDAAAPDKPTKVEAIPATVGGGVAWRADGGEIVFAAQTPDDAPPGYEDLYALALSGEAGARDLTRGFVGQLTASGAVYAGGALVAMGEVGTRATPVRIALNGEVRPASIDLGATHINGLQTNLKQTGWVWLRESGGKQTELCYAPRLGGACTAIAKPELTPAGLKAVAPELVNWASADGKFTIEGLLYLPERASAAAKVPLIVDVHGGPFGAFVDRYDAFVAYLVGHGWAVLRTNPRGSSNYGVAFAAANKNDLGGGDFSDVISGVDTVLKKYPIDEARMALMGYSYGGEMAGFAVGKTDRFKAIVSGAPVIDQFSEYGTENGSRYDRWYFGRPWERMEDAWRQSPLSGVAKGKTPLLLLQGQSDRTDPEGQAQEMYRALRQMGVPVELVTYPREDHGPLAMGIFGRPSQEPWHGFDARQRIVEFIEKSFETGKK